MADFLVPTLVITVLILVNGLFVAAEFAIAGVSRTAMEAHAQEGNRVAGVVAAMLRDPRRQDQYIATAQLGITFATLGLGMYGEHQLAVGLYNYFDGSGWADWLASHAVASVLAVAIITYFHIVVGEMVPKALALQKPERAAIFVTPPMLWMRNASIVLVLALNGTGNAILRLLGIRREAGLEQQYTPAELQFIIRESAEQGQLQESSAQVLHELFEFGTLDAESVMAPRVKMRGIPLDASDEEVFATVLESRHSRYPVYDDNLDQIVGMIHIKDLLQPARNGKGIVRANLRPVPFVPETSRANSVLEVMRRERTQLVIVLDEHGGTAGMVTMEDLVEEVMTPIEEEVDRKPELYLDAGGRLRAAGTTRLEQVGEHFGIELHHDEVETVSGLVLMLLDRPARVADSVSYDGVRFDVMALAGRGVAECMVRLEPDREAEIAAES